MILWRLITIQCLNDNDDIIMQQWSNHPIDPIIQLIQWSNIQRSNDPMIQWSNWSNWANDPMIQWSNDPMIQWSNDPMIQWSNDPVIQWSNWSNDLIDPMI